ncbi:MAG: DUF2240 family protein [Thermoprotei archaeon]
MKEEEKEQFEKILESIVSKYPKISKDELVRMINEKINSLGGMINRDVAALLVAQSLGLDVTNLVGPYRKEYKSHILASGLRGITIIGKVMYVSPLRTINVNDEKKSFVTVILNDDSGNNIEVTFWGSMVQSALKLRMGYTVEIYGGTVKELTPEAKINVSRGSIKILNQGEPEFRDIIAEHASATVISGHVVDLYDTGDDGYPVAVLIRSDNLQHRVLFTNEQAKKLYSKAYVILKGCFIRSLSENVVDSMMSVDGIIDTYEKEAPQIVEILDVDSVYNLKTSSYINITGLIRNVNDKIFMLGANFCIPVKSTQYLNDGVFTLKGILFGNLNKPILIVDKFSKIIQEQSEVKKDASRNIQFEINRYYYIHGKLSNIKYIELIRTCPVCGFKLNSWENFCSKCGYKGPFNSIPELSFVLTNNLGSIEVVFHGKDSCILIGYDEQAIIDAVELGIINYLKELIEDSIKGSELIIGGSVKDVKPLIIAREVYKLKSNEHDKIAGESKRGREEEKKEASEKSNKEDSQNIHVP